MSRLSVINILILGLGLLFNHCQCTCSEYPTYTLTDKDKEWVCYKEGQIIKFVSNLGNVREYKVTGLTDHIVKIDKEPSSKTAITFKSCPEFKYQEVYCILVNINNEYDKINWWLYSTDSQNPGNEPFVQLSSSYDFSISFNTRFIDENENTFNDGEDIDPPYLRVYLKNLIIQTKVYQNIYKKPSGSSNLNLYCYYSKTFGLIKFDTNKETWEISQ